MPSPTEIEFRPETGKTISAWEVLIGSVKLSEIRWTVWDRFDDKAAAFAEMNSRMLAHMEIDGRTYTNEAERQAILADYNGPPIQIVHVGRTVIWGEGWVPA